MRLENKVAVVTGAGSGIGRATAERFIPSVPLGRLNTPRDIAHAALYLASDEAFMVTGTAFEIDGGRDI